MRLVRIAVVVLAIGCSDGGTDHDEELPAVCQEIVDACHEPGENGDAESEACHETAHEGDESACEADHDSCIATCEAATPA